MKKKIGLIFIALVIGVLGFKFISAKNRLPVIKANSIQVYIRW